MDTKNQNKPPRRLLTLILCILMIIGLMPVSAFAGSGSQAGSGGVAADSRDDGAQATQLTASAFAENPLEAGPASDPSETGSLGKGDSGSVAGDDVGIIGETEGSLGDGDVSASSDDTLGTDTDPLSTPMSLGGGATQFSRPWGCSVARHRS